MLADAGGGMTIIGISGYAESGKDTIAAHLVHDHGFIRVAFADRLRELVLRIDPICTPSGRTLARIVDEHGWEHAKRIPEVRRLLQEVGTGVRDVVADDAWVHALFEPIDRERAWDFVNLVIPDVRFPNEVAAIRERGGVVWRVNRPGTTAVNRHISERAIDGMRFDETIDNKLSIGWLHRQVDDALERLKEASDGPG